MFDPRSYREGSVSICVGGGQWCSVDWYEWSCAHVEHLSKVDCYPYHLLDGSLSTYGQCLRELPWPDKEMPHRPTRWWSIILEVWRRIWRG